MEKYIFYHCPLCGNMLTREAGSTDHPVCCGESMQRLVAQTADSSTEKHVPVITIDGNKVTVVVGSTLHPMLSKHYIMHIYLVTSKGLKSAFLEPEQAPEALFTLEEGETVLGAYEYCNIHGLWYAAAE